jgi:DNA polymerase theta
VNPISAAYCRASSSCCRTLSGRRRYLPKITAGATQYSRAAAERQAINTSVQGSAADLVKTAMNEIENRICAEFPQCALPLRPNREREGGSAKRQPGGAYFLLQMHDELIYEVRLFFCRLLK